MTFHAGTERLVLIIGGLVFKFPKVYLFGYLKVTLDDLRQKKFPWHHH